MDPAAVNGSLEGWGQKPDERPIDPVVEDVARLRGMTQTGIARQDGLIGDGGIVNRKGANEKAIARNSMSVRLVCAR